MYGIQSQSRYRIYYYRFQCNFVCQNFPLFIFGINQRNFPESGLNNSCYHRTGIKRVFVGKAKTQYRAADQSSDFFSWRLLTICACYLLLLFSVCYVLFAICYLLFAFCRIRCIIGRSISRSIWSNDELIIDVDRTKHTYVHTCTCVLLTRYASDRFVIHQHLAEKKVAQSPFQRSPHGPNEICAEPKHKTVPSWFPGGKFSQKAFPTILKCLDKK